MQAAHNVPRDQKKDSLCVERLSLGTVGARQAGRAPLLQTSAPPRLPRPYDLSGASEFKRMRPAYASTWARFSRWSCSIISAMWYLIVRALNPSLAPASL